jgi:DNA invertase Pin-like site-specific DNA recombinase
MRAAQYVRMSTEHQQYSIENQIAAIQEYADSHGFEIVRTYSDAARSGLDLKRRPGLRQLIEDVVGGRADYKAVLVFDVSRWGRFQDADESAHYEFLCKSAGVPIHYCAEPFSNADSIADTLLKTLKRSMAAEYIRELSAKVFAGQCRIARNGYKLGGSTLGALMGRIPRDTFPRLIGGAPPPRRATAQAVSQQPVIEHRLGSEGFDQQYGLPSSKSPHFDRMWRRYFPCSHVPMSVTRVTTCCYDGNESSPRLNEHS